MKIKIFTILEKFFKQILRDNNIATDWVYWEVQGQFTYPHKGHSSEQYRRIIHNRKSKQLGITQNFQDGHWSDGEFNHLDPINVHVDGCNECVDAIYEKKKQR